MRYKSKPASVKVLLETPLAKPWHYRRSGVYYLRVRPQGSTESCTLSLRTNDRSIAMSSSKQLLKILRTFHLENPDSDWGSLRDYLREVAETILATPTEWDLMDCMGLVYSDLREDLHRLAVTQPLTVPQAKAVILGQQIMQAAETRVGGDPRALVSVIEGIDREAAREAAGSVSASLSVGPALGQSSMTFEHLAALYMAEQATNVEASTMRDIRSTCAGLSEALGGLDLRRHSREDLVNVKATLLEGKKPSTVNKYLTRLSTVLSWALNNGYIERSFDKGLKLTKGADSSREAFSQEQVQAVMKYANGLDGSSWERWGLSLGVLTGARIAEVRQLTKRDVRQVGTHWVIDINDNDGKSIKNQHSARIVPLVDGAYGFQLAAFLQFVDELPKGGPLFGLSAGRFSEVLNGALRTVLGFEAGGDLSFHSLRHSLASLLKFQGVAVGIAQSILGHSSQSITFDHYGGGEQVGLERLVQALAATYGGITE